jgi:hypothetical protein
MFYRFEYEAASDTDLDRLPLFTRMKLDLAGIKLTLRQWQAFAIEERRVLCHLGIDNEEELATFADYVSYLCGSHHLGPAERLPPVNPALWNSALPGPVRQASRQTGQPIEADEWMHWRSHERYALYKTAVSKNEPEKFAAVLTELRSRKSAS